MRRIRTRGLADAGRVGEPVLDVVVLGLDARAVEVAQELGGLRLLVRHLRRGREEAVDDRVEHVEHVGLLALVVELLRVVVEVGEEARVRDGLVAVGAAGVAGERVAELREADDIVEAGEVRLLAGGIRLLEDGLELGGDRLDLGGVGIVLEAERQGELRGLRLLDLPLPVEPGVVLRLQLPREAPERLRAEEVRERVAGQELGVHPAVGERDFVDVFVDFDLTVGGRGRLGGVEMFRERNFRDVFDFDGHGLFLFWVLLLPSLHKTGRKGYKKCFFRIFPTPMRNARRLGAFASRADSRAGSGLRGGRCSSKVPPSSCLWSADRRTVRSWGTPRRGYFRGMPRSSNQRARDSDDSAVKG